MSKPVASNHDRFWENVEKTDTCWLWTGEVPKSGYGQMGVRQPDGRWLKRQVHRMAYEIFVGPIPDGLEIDHTCFVPLCVNPDHLEAVTPQENCRRRGLRRTHCPHGHPYEGENLLIAATRIGGIHRRCKICTRARQRANHDRRRDEGRAEPGAEDE